MTTYILLNVFLVFFGAHGDISWQAHHAAKLTYANLPLIIGLAGKNNVLSWATGFGYESFNVLHRWSARFSVLLMAIHVGGRIYVNEPNVNPSKVGQRYVAWGWAAFAMMLYMIGIASRPMRNRFYQFFLAQHVFLWVVIAISLAIHRPQQQGWIWSGFILYGLDTFIRLGRIFWFPYVKKLDRDEAMAPLGLVTVLSDDTVRVSVRTRQQWVPGQHVYLHLPVNSFGGHPFTVSNISRPLAQANNDKPFESTQELLIRVRGGLTKHLFDIGMSQRDPQIGKVGVPLKAWTEGPYGHTKYLGEDYNTLLLVAGGSGVTYALTNAMDIIRRARAMGIMRAAGVASDLDLARALDRGMLIATKGLRFIWVVKKPEQVSWIDDHLKEMCDMAPPGLFHLSIYITCPPSCEVSVMQGYVTEDRRKSGEPSSDLSVQHGSTVEIRYGRPDFADVVFREIEATDYSDWLAIGCCGPSVMNDNLACVVSAAVKPLNVLRGETRRNIFLTIEEFGW